MTEDLAQCLSSGMDEVITKPFRFAEFISALSRCAERVAAQPREPAPVAVQASRSVQVLDEAVLAQMHELVGGDPAALNELVQSHLGAAQRLLATLEQQLAEKNYAAMERTVHSLSGSTGFFGEAELVRRIAALQSALREQRSDEISPLVSDVLGEHDCVRAALLAHLQRHAAPAPPGGTAD